MTIRTPFLAALRRPTALLLVLFMLAAVGCDNASDGDDDPPPPPPATTGTVAGQMTLPPGTNGSVANARVALYADQDDYFTDSFAYQIGAGGDGSYSIGNVVPGTYFMDVWKDNNNDGVINSGDFYGVFGSLTAGNVNLTPISVAAGQTATISFAITQLP